VIAFKRGFVGGVMLAVIITLIVVEAVATVSTWPGRAVLRAAEALRGRFDR
jgi:hypothetical protein